MTVRIIQPRRSVRGTLSVPGDKSISHRALIFAALAHGQSQVANLAPGQDVRSTARVLAQLGVPVTIHANGSASVVGAGFEGLQAPVAPLDCGNSGTTLRLMMGVLAGRPFTSTLIGDASLSARPMKRIAEPLSAMGARFDLTDGKPPVTVHGGPLKAVDWESRIASAQVKSAIVLAGLQAPGTTTTSEPVLSRDHTERMLAAMGARLQAEGLRVRVSPGAIEPLGRFTVPGDVSSAAFLLAIGTLLDGPGLTLRDVGTNPTRTGILEILVAMGAHIDRTDEKEHGEPTATLRVKRAALTAVDIGGAALVRAIDEVPILAVLATQAAGRTIIRDAQELRVKECDRLAATHAFLSDMGAAIEETPDGLIIDGPTPLHGAEVQTHHDHRIAMAAAVAGLSAIEGETRILGADCAAVSYPDFFADLDRITA